MKAGIVTTKSRDDVGSLRRITYEINNQDLLNEAVVYLMTIGDMFYIGQTRKYEHRIRAHRSNIQRVELYPATRVDSYTIIREHLLSINGPVNVRFDVLEVCKDGKAAELAEEWWFCFFLMFGMNDLLLNWNLGKFGVNKELMPKADHKTDVKLSCL